MKKIYLLFVFCCLSFSGFSATWYSIAAGGAVNTLTNWNSLASGAGVTPPAGQFAVAGDIWVVQSNMTIAGAAAWTLGGSLQINTGSSIRKSAAAGTNTITIGGNLTLAGTGVISYAAAPAGSIIINLAGNLSLTGTSTITNPGTGTNTINFSGAGTLAAPQTITWTSTGTSTNTSLTVNTGTYVQLLSNVPLPTGSPTGMTVNGSLVCGTFVMSSGTTDAFTVSSGANFYTANAGGINGSVTAMSSTSFSSTANYIYNGAVAQVTGTLLPTAINSGGSVTINNSSTGVTLSQTTNFASGVNLNLENGTLINTAANLVMASGSNVNCDNGNIAVAATTYSGVNLTYMDLGINAAAVTTGNEWPAAFTGNVVVNKAISTGTVTLNGSKAVTGPITLDAGTLDVSATSYNISLTGNWINNELSSAFPFNAEAGTVTMNGIAPQTIGGSNSSFFNNFTINNAAGVSLAGVPEYVNGTFTFVNGRLNVGSTAIFFGPLTPAIAGTLSSANMIVCTPSSIVGKGMGGSGSFTFPVGDGAGNYTPITINMTGSAFISSSGMSVQMNNVKDPNNADVSNYINRYWNISTSAITTPIYTAVATYVPGDVVGTEANISAGEYPLALPWNKYGVTNTATHTLTTGTITALGGDISGISTAGPTVTASASTSICAGYSTPISVASATGDPTLSYSWAPAGSLSVATGVSVIATPTITTTYTVTVTDGNGFTSTATTTVTVNSSPSITSPGIVCVGLIAFLNGTPGGGAWVSTVPTVGTVDPVSGAVEGIGAGTTIISYTALGCTSTSIMTVVASPASISGPNTVCVGNSITLIETSPGGTWSTSDLTVSLGSTGIVTGNSAGTATISYTTIACNPTTYVVTVNAYPSAITAPTSLCMGAVTTLADLTSGGNWTSSNAGIAPVGSASGIVSGSAVGTATITYTAGGCAVTQPMTVNPAPSAIIGLSVVCVGGTLPLTDITAGGTWSTSAAYVATVDPTGNVTGILPGAAATIFYTAGGCAASQVVSVVASPSVIGGLSAVCVGDSILLTDSVGGGVWSSSASGSASIATPPGTVKGIAPGSVTITYTLPGCPTAVTHNVTVNPVPGPITGVTTLCDGIPSEVYDLTNGGTWSTIDTFVAVAKPTPIGGSIGTGTVTGVSLGVTSIVYTMPNGCFVLWQVTVNPAAPPISGTDTICATGSAWLTDIVGGGNWTSSNPAVATITSTTGLLTGLVTGITYIVYTLPTGCSTSLLETSIPPVAPIIGASHVCSGSVVNLADTAGGGTWSSSNIYVAQVDSAGKLTALYPDTVVITYMVSAFKGCYANETITVNPLPTPVITYNYGTHSVSTSGFYSSYQWYNDNTGLIPGATGAAYSLPHANDSVSVTVTDANGCTGSASWFYYDYTGVKNINAASARIYPNPATTTLFIESAVAVRAVVNAVDGKMIIDQADAKQLDITDLASGVYIVTLYDDGGQAVLTGKLVKE